MGADIVVGEGQSIGNALNFGGPYVGLFATRLKYVRQMPGRLAGETVDAEGRRSFVLTLSTREQHIRREKATSNICTNSGLCALAFSIHMSCSARPGCGGSRRSITPTPFSSPTGSSAIEGRRACSTTRFFNEFTFRTPRPAADLIEALARRGVIGGLPVSRLLPGRRPRRPHRRREHRDRTTDADRAAYRRGARECGSADERLEA